MTLPNGGRALKLLESAGLIKVDPAAGYTPTKKDITENPLNLDIKEVEAANTASLLPDVAAAVINGGHAVDNGLNPKEDAIFLESVEEGSDNPYVNIIVARTADKDNELYKKSSRLFPYTGSCKSDRGHLQGSLHPDMGVTPEITAIK